MRRTRLEYFGLLLVTPVLLLATGCGEPEPDPEGVIMYIKKARVGDKVRRLWPEGHQYVTSVLKADAEYRGLVGGLLDLRAPRPLWKIDDEQWRKAEAVTNAIEALDELLDDLADTKRHDAFTALDDAISEAPGGVEASEVWQALVWRGEDLRQIGVQVPDLLKLAEQRKALFTLVQEHADAFDPAEGKSGLAFTDPAAQRAILEAHATAQAAIDAYQEKYRAYVLAGFEDAEKRIEALKTEKDALKAQKIDGKAKRALEYRIDYQMARRKHFRDEKKTFEKKIPASSEG